MPDSGCGLDAWRSAAMRARFGSAEDRYWSRPNFRMAASMRSTGIA
jgi:hypothetical protein